MRSGKCDVPLCPRVKKGKRIVFGGQILNCCHRHYNWIEESLAADGRPVVK